ncbi:hypothetical protein IFM89_029628, partial [Coptis chinensis]
GFEILKSNMPRSSRHKSHKQHKHNNNNNSSKEVKEHSDSEEVIKEVRVLKESGSSEKRKHDGGNTGLVEENNNISSSSSKRRKERSDVDRWNGGDKEKEKEKQKVLVDSKSGNNSKSLSRSEKKEVNVVVVGESEDVVKKSKVVESKSKDLSRKEKEHVVERSTKVQDVRHERSGDRGIGKSGVVESEGSRKQTSHLEERSATKLEVGNTEWLRQEDLRNAQLDKELEKRTRRKRDDSDEKDKYPDDVRDSNGRRLSSKDERHKDEKYKEDRYRDKYREDLDREHRNRDDRVRDDRTPKDPLRDRSDTRHSRDESRSVENRHKKSKTQNSDYDGSPYVLDDRATRYKDYRGKKRSSDEEDRSDLKPQNNKERRHEVEKKLSGGKVELPTDRGRSRSRLVDGDSTITSSRRKSSPVAGSHLTKDQYRHSSKLNESKYKESVHEERVRDNVASRELTNASAVPDRAFESHSMDKPKSMEKPIYKDKSQPSTEKTPIADAQVSPLQLKEKSHSSTSNERRHSNRTPVRRSFDVEESGHRRSGSKDARDYSAIEDRGSQEWRGSQDWPSQEWRGTQDWPSEKPAADDFSQQDGDTVSVSSSFNRTNHPPNSSSSALPPPPPFRTGVDSPSVYGSYEEDSRGKSSNRYKRSGDNNIGRGQGNAWKGVPNWSTTPVTNGFIPFQHVQPPGGFHPLMPQFAGPLFGVRPSLELNPTGLPYHIPDADRYSGHGRPFGWRNRPDESCPPHLHGWDGSNGVLGDGAHMQGKPDWEQNRHMMTDRGWEASAELWKGQNSGISMEFPSASQKEDNHLRVPMDEVWAGKSGQRSRNDRSRSVSRAESIEIKRSDDIITEIDHKEAPKQVVPRKTPETSKTVNDNGFCRVYLSKLDISVELADIEVYKQCRSIMDIEGDSADGDVSMDLSTEENGKAGMKILNTNLTAPLFPAIKDSVLQRAMALYKKQGEEMKTRFPVSSFLSKESVSVSTKDREGPDLTINAQKQVPVPFISGEAEEVVEIPPSTQKLTEEQVLASDHEKLGETVTASTDEKLEDAFPTSGQEIAEEHSDKKDDAASNFCKEVVEPVISLGSDEPEEHTPSINHVEKADTVAIIISSLENLEVVEDPSFQHALLSTVLPSGSEDCSMACDGDGNCSTNVSEGKQAFTDDTMFGVLGVTDGTEALAPMSIDECKSVNLSRIHNSPESTH